MNLITYYIKWLYLFIREINKNSLEIGENLEKIGGIHTKSPVPELLTDPGCRKNIK